jgi:hypothetical protein
LTSPHLTRVPDPTDHLRRVITFRASPGRVDAVVEDNVHEFAVTLGHDGKTVTEVKAEAIRFPWTTCPMGVERLKNLIGAPLAGATRGQIDPVQQCTHMLDLARLAMAQAGRGGDRVYELEFCLEPGTSARLGEIRRDGALLFTWRDVDDHITTPGPFEGHATTVRSEWSEAVLADPDLLEAAMIMRRGLLVFRGRIRLGVVIDRASDQPYMAGACLTYQPERMAVAVRPAGFGDFGFKPPKVVTRGGGA